MAYLIYGRVCHREGQKNKRPVFQFYSKLNYASYCYYLGCIWGNQPLRSIRITFENLRFVVKLFRRHLMMTSAYTIYVVLILLL